MGEEASTHIQYRLIQSVPVGKTQSFKAIIRNYFLVVCGPCFFQHTKIYTVQVLTVGPRTLGKALPGKAWHKILIEIEVLQGPFCRFPYYLYLLFDLYLTTPLAETIIHYMRRYIRNADIVMLQLVERHVLLCVHLVCRKKHGP